MENVVVCSFWWPQTEAADLTVVRSVEQSLGSCGVTWQKGPCRRNERFTHLNSSFPGTLPWTHI